MTQVTGKDIVDFMAHGIESIVKENLRDRLVNRLVDEFKKEITDIIDDQLSQMVFNAYSRESPMEMRQELALLIEWSKGTAEYKKKYTIQSEIVED